jgi:hypothetical protein
MTSKFIFLHNELAKNKEKPFQAPLSMIQLYHYPPYFKLNCNCSSTTYKKMSHLKS